MLPVRCVLHIGAPKCGSSALQRHLAFTPEPVVPAAGLDGPVGRLISYCAVVNGQVLRGSDLTHYATLTPTQYVACDSVDVLVGMSDVALTKVGDGLRAVASTGRLPVLSQESFFIQHAAFSNARILERLGVETTVVAYVRPPIDFINSAWWQWGPWSGTPFETFVTDHLETAKWADHLRAWRDVPGVAHVEARLLPDDVVRDFRSLDSPTSARRNFSLPGSVLRTLGGLPELRAWNDSETDETVRRWIRDLPRAAPWVLDRATSGRIVSETRQASTALMEYLRPRDLPGLAKNDRWWDAPNQPAEPPSKPASEQDLLDTVDLLTRALLAADRRVREMRADAFAASTGASLPARRLSADGEIVTL